MSRLTRDNLTSKVEEIPLPELGGTVAVRGLTRAELRALRERAGIGSDVAPDEEQLDLLFVAFGLADPRLIDGDRITDNGAVDEAVRFARGLPGGSVAHIVARVMWLTGLRGLTEEGQDRGSFRSGTADDDRRRDVLGASDRPGSGGDDSGGDAPADEQH